MVILQNQNPREFVCNWVKAEPQGDYAIWPFLIAMWFIYGTWSSQSDVEFLSMVLAWYVKMVSDECYPLLVVHNILLSSKQSRLWSSEFRSTWLGALVFPILGCGCGPSFCMWKDGSESLGTETWQWGCSNHGKYWLSLWYLYHAHFIKPMELWPRDPLSSCVTSSFDAIVSQKV